MMTDTFNKSTPMAVYVTVKVMIKADADPQDIFAECDYNFEHDDIVETEIIDVETV